MTQETIVQGERSGLWFAWNGSHTVNVRHDADGHDVDVFSIGDFATDRATYEEFVESVAEMDAEYAEGEW